MSDGLTQRQRRIMLAEKGILGLLAAWSAYIIGTYVFAVAGIIIVLAGLALSQVFGFRWL